MKRGMVIYASSPMNGVESAGRGRSGTKEVEKKRKNLLTRRLLRGRLNEFTAHRWNGSVPCKLNNVKTN